MKLLEEAKKAVETVRPCLVATASKSGKPNVSAKGSVRVLDDEHITFIDVASPRTSSNIKENPQVAILCLDPATRKGCRVWGQARLINSGETYNKVIAAQSSKTAGKKVNNVVVMTVEEVEMFQL